jgi:DNA-binding cell septation regulator SpoVG
MAAIEVLAIRRLDGKSTVKAFCDVKIGGVTLKGCKIVQQDGQRAWLAMPSIKTERAWQNVVELSKPLREAATEIVLAAWESRQKTQVHRIERPADPRQNHIDELAAAFDRRPADDLEDAL